MLKAGESSKFFLESEVRKIGRDYFLSVGIDPEYSDSAKLTRLAELKNGEEQLAEEYQRALDFHQGKSADVFHALLKLRLGQ